MSTKQAIIIRRDLKMRRGKEIAQGSHASMEFLITKYERNISLSQAEKEWISNLRTKVVLQTDSESALLGLWQDALNHGLTVFTIVDEGLTEFHGRKTITALAIGPDWSEKIDAVTANLKLY